VSAQGIEVEDTFRDGLKHTAVKTPTAQYIIYNIKKWVCLKTRVVLRKRLISTCPDSSSSPPPSPQEKKSTTYPKTSSHEISHHQCADPGIDPIGSPHPRIQCSGPLQKDPHPEPASDRVLTSSRTRIPSPLAIAREHRGTRSNNLPRRKATETCASVMGQDYPFTGPSPGANPTTYPSSLPQALGKLYGNIPSQKTDCQRFFFSSVDLNEPYLI